MKTYLINCEKCKTKTAHMIFMTSKKRGVKLRCLKCGTLKKRYHKLNFLNEVEL